MGKKFQQVVISVVEIALWYYTRGLTSTIGKIAHAAFLQAGINTLANVAIGAISGPRRQGPPPLNVTVHGTVEYRRLIFGTRRAGGVLVFYGVSGPDNKYLWYVIVYAGLTPQHIEDLVLCPECDTSAAPISEPAPSISPCYASVPAWRPLSRMAPWSMSTALRKYASTTWWRFKMAATSS